MKTYRWRGPTQALTITHEGREIGITLMPGRAVELPEDHPMVACWLGSGELEEVTEPPRKGGKQKKETRNA